MILYFWIPETVGMRLSMTIFRKPGLFLSSEQVETSVPHRTHVNSPVISAAVDGRKIENLEQKVKLVFKPEKVRYSMIHCPHKTKHTHKSVHSSSYGFTNDY